MSVKAPRGTKDITPEESYKWRYLEDAFRRICSLYGYEEIRTPAFESVDLFKRGVGDTTDIVQKEMYTFTDKGNREYALKPEGTAGVVRSFIENKMYAQPQPTKLFYITPCFRYERPQAGRQRQFHQFGIEALGSENPSIDAETIGLALQFLKEVGLENLEVSINSVGCPVCRKPYNEMLKKYLNEKSDQLCALCNERKDRNPMRVIDCKVESCQAAIVDIPLIADHLCEECEEHFSKLKENLDIMGIKYKVNKKIVRGLDYYKRTAFEIISDDLGAQSTVCGGGRYDGLVEQLGGPKNMPGIGFGLGVERLLLILESKGIVIENPQKTDIFIVTIGDKAKLESAKILSDLRQNNISADTDHLDRSVKAQFKYSNKINAKYTVVIGDTEIDNDEVRLKNMDTSEQSSIKLTELVEVLSTII